MLMITCWGMVQSNPRGEAWEDFILQENLVVCNIGTKKYLWGTHGILYYWSHPHHFGPFLWDQLMEGLWGRYTLLDHKLIEFTMNDTHEYDKPKRFRYEKADSQKFADILDNSCKEWHQPRTWNKYRLEKYYMHFLREVKHAMRSIIPYLPQNKLLNIPQFRDQELLTTKEQAKKAWKKWRLDVSNQDRYQAYSEARKSNPKDPWI